ncbi:hypothetical protein N431DRAFT_231558 [Stipitochalara longipes BDJ]|nr:hypothetical protein N431DRAFT_231558 [Stipitochalara longipes BDJ]
MKLSHDLQFVEGHWKRLDIEERTGEPSLSRDLPNCSTSDETGHMLAQGSAISQAPDEPEVNIFAPSNAQNAQRKLSVEATPERSNFKIVESNPQSTPVSSNGEKHHCSNCNETFSTQTALDEHKGRQHRKFLLWWGWYCS